MKIRIKATPSLIYSRRGNVAAPPLPECTVDLKEASQGSPFLLVKQNKRALGRQDIYSIKRTIGVFMLKEKLKLDERK